MSCLVCFLLRWLLMFCPLEKARGSIVRFRSLIVILCSCVSVSAIASAAFAADRDYSFGTAGDLALEAQADSTFVLYMDTVSGDPGAFVDYFVSLRNARAVGTFDLMIHYDPTVLIATNVSSSDTRCTDFESFAAELGSGSSAGNIHVRGVADLVAPPNTLPLAAGDGPIFKIVFRITSQIVFSGMTAPVRFDLSTSGNSLTTDSGTTVPQSGLVFVDGYVFVDSLGEKSIGDINLNGIAGEIGDAIYFSNYFINPVEYPLNPLQMMNSDINDDGLMGTVADLVSLINWILSGHGQPKVGEESWSVAHVSASAVDQGISLDYQSEFPIGAVLVTATINRDYDISAVTSTGTGLDVLASVDGDQLRVLVYSLSGNSLPAGEGTFISLAGLDEATISSVDLSTAGGTTARVTFSQPVAELPGRFELNQNYPNPFNPETRIVFNLYTDARARLAVFDLLGREIKTLIDETLAAGDHSVVWDGKDAVGRPVASGVYFYRLETAAGSDARKMMLLK